MNKTALSIFTVSCVLGLAACSSGGSDGHIDPSTENAKTPNASTTPSVNSAAPTSRIGGNALTTNKTDASDINRYAISNGSIDKITIDGRTIDLNLSGDDLNGFTHIPHSAAEYTSVGKQFKYLRFGTYINWIRAPQGVLPAYNFVIGHITPDSDVPVNGTVIYKGNALVKPVGDGGWFQSFSSFDVDFGNKTLNGRFDYNGNDNDNIHVSGTIKGASFSGVRDGVTMQGNFYGPQAAELGGTFSGPITRNGIVTNATGSFGASKQE